MLSLKDAIESGATALFGEKYGDSVRVVNISDYSRELCGGTHAQSTGEAGVFKIISEGAIAAGVRRIEAVTAAEACRHIKKEENILLKLSGMLKTDQSGITDKIERMITAQKKMEQEIEKLKSQIVAKQADSILDLVRDVSGIKVLAAIVDAKDAKTLRDYGDKIRDRLGSGIIVFGAKEGEKAHLLAMVTKDIAGKFPAGKIISEIAPVVGGKGGGRNDMAQAGGKSPEKLQEALKKAVGVIESIAGQ